MILSDDRQAHLAHIIVDGIWNDDLVDFTDDDAAIRHAKRAIALWVKEADQADTNVRAKIASLKRTIIESTPEWDVMYAKYYEEEMGKRGQN